MEPVRLTRRFVTMGDHSQDPPNPHLVFPQWSPWSIYPYQYWGSMQRRVVRQRYYLPTLENEYVRVTIAPDLGGRIWDVFDKVSGRHLANFNSGVRSYNAGFGLNYTAGGIECNYPLAHSPTTRCPREVSALKHEDGSASVVISEYERIWGTRWAVAYTLYPGRSLIELRVRVYNRTPFDSRYMYWNNCGFVLTTGSRFIFPEDAGAMHGKASHSFSWPRWQHRDLSLWRDVPPEMLGLYLLEAREPFFGYYDEAGGFGLVHYADLADLPGKKYWTWGTDPQEVKFLRRTHHTLGETYGEVQSGRIVIQEHLDRVPPETEFEWRAVWYPVRATGAFNAAGPGAALRAELLNPAGRSPTVQVVASGNGEFAEARAVARVDNAVCGEMPLPLSPRQSTTGELILPGPVTAASQIRVEVRAGDGRLLAVWRRREVDQRDSWREVVEIQGEPKPLTAEQAFLAAEAEARDWGNHDLRPAYERVLKLDDGHAPTHRELGKVALARGLYEEAIAHFRAALIRDADSLEARYFLGVALTMAGRTEEARPWLELAARYDWEARALVRLAELDMHAGEWHQALVYLDRLAEARPRLTRPRGLRAACCRRLGQRGAAAREIAAALRIDEQDPFLQVEAMLIRSPELGRWPAAAKRRLLDQIRRHEPPLLEAAFDYLAAGLFREAAAVTELIPAPGPVALLVRAWAFEQSGQSRVALRALRQACRADPVGHGLWHLQMLDVMAWARARLPTEPRLLLHLGNLLVARRRLEEGVALWRRAAELGETHFLLFSSLGYYERRLKGDSGAALECFRKAAAANPADLYVKREIFQACRSLKRPGEAERYLEGEIAAVKTSPPLAHELLSAYLERNDFERFDALCSSLDFSVNWQLAGPHSLWFMRHLREALHWAHTGDWRRAAAILEDLTETPAHLGAHLPNSIEEDRRLYHLGCCYAKLGQEEKARHCWELALAVPHFTGYEMGYWFKQWSRRYYQALSLLKLGRESEAGAYFDAMELLAKHSPLPLSARKAMMELVERGRFAPDEEKDALALAAVEVKTTAEA